jgi:arylsulfatase A-like enzyme
VVLNILLILADDIGPGDVRTYRGTHATPLLGKQALAGARFWNAWATPVCLATRAGLMTGLYGPRTGHVGHVDNLADAQRLDAAFIEVGTIADALHGLGYTTAVTGKWQHGVSSAACGFDHCFTWNRWNQDGEIYPRYWGPTLWRDGVKETFSEDAYGPDILADWTIDFFRQRSPPGGISWPTFVLHNELLAHREGGVFHPTPDDPTPSLKGSITYWTMIVDRMVTALPDTLIIIMSDNGSEDGAKIEATAAGAACILIVIGPGVVPGERHQLVDVTDHYATILELAGATAPCGRDGVSYARALAEPSAPGREWIYSWLDDKDMVRTATRAREGDGTVRDLSPGYFGEIIQGVR